MQNIANLLGKKYRSEMRYFRAVEIIEKNWGVVVKDLDRFLVPRNIYKNELVIECNNPVWMSEIDCFKQQIVDKVNRLLKDHASNIKIVGVKPIFNASLVLNHTEKRESPPKTIEERIRWSVSEKRRVVQSCV